MLAGFTLQSWAIQIQGVVCNNIYEINLEPIIRQAFPEQVTIYLYALITIKNMYIR